MKLDEIIQTNVTNNKLNTSFKQTDKFSPGNRANPHKMLGGGVRYNAYDDDNDPHMIRKSTNAPNLKKHVMDDANKEYVKALVDQQLTGNNIWVPRVYDFTTTTDDDGNEHYDYRMEKLVASNDVREDEVLDSVKNLLGPYYDNDEYINLSAPHDYTSDSDADLGGAFDITDYVAGLLWEMIEMGSYVTTVPELNQALKLIHDVWNSNTYFNLDLHGHNIMYRRTPVGVQLVINDPLI
jgi:hypothetical protein